jgi:tetratricopeptide (TPR) repeat protein
MRLSLRLTQWIVLGVALGMCGLLAGCADAPPTPTPMVHDATASSIVKIPTSTCTPVPIPTLTPTPTSTRQPTDTSTPTWTSTPMPTVTAIPTLTPTPTAAAEPSAQLEVALHHQTNGDYAQAIAVYLAVLEDNPTPGQTRLARYHLAESYLLDREDVLAADAWKAFIADYPDDDRLPSARLMAARAYHAANQCAQAIPYYEAYLAHANVLADMVYEWLGDCHAADGRLEEAIGSYRQALVATGDRSIQVGLREKIAGAYLALEEYSAAVEEYDAILNVARIDSYRAKIEYLAGQALAAAGDTEGAQVRYRRAVDSYPSAEYAYLSLVELVDAGVEVNEFQRGLVDYYAGASHPDAYGAAVRAFDRYLATVPPEKADQALYRKALAQRALDQPEAALETLETLIAGYPKSTLLPQAWWEKGVTLAAMGHNDAAVKTYQDLAAFFPADDLAPKALWQAAQLREGERAFLEGAKLYQEVQASFPAFENADEALWRAGLAYYRAGDREKAIANWQALLDRYPKSSYRSKSLYWLGKLGAEPASQGAHGYWEQLTAAYPDTYYALRVEQIRSGGSLTATRLITAAVEPPPWDAVQVSSQILDWLQSWTQVPTDTNLLTLPVTWTQRFDFRRGEALLAIGLRHEALGAFDGVREAAWDDPVALAQLTLFFRGQGLPDGRSVDRHPARRTVSRAAPGLSFGLRRLALRTGTRTQPGSAAFGRAYPPGKSLRAGSRIVRRRAGSGPGHAGHRRRDRPQPENG